MKKVGGGKGSQKLAPFPVAPGDFTPDAGTADFVNTVPAQPAAGPAPFSVGADEFTPDAPEPTAPTGPQIGTAEAALRGAGQGATLNFSDELVGLGKALFGDIGDTLSGKDTRGTFGAKYRTARDIEREANRAAAEQHPFAYGAGDVAGSVATSFIPGLGAAKGVQTVGQAAKVAAKLGGIAGLGASEEDSIPGMLADAGKSALISGATGGLVHKFIGGAPERAAKRLIGDVTDGVPATLRDKIVGKAGAKGATASNDFNGTLVRLMRETPEIRKAGRDPNALIEACDMAIEPRMAAIDSIFSRSARATPGIPVHEVQTTVDGIAKRLESNPGTRPLARAVRNQLDDIYTSWVEPAVQHGNGFTHGPTPHVTANQVREFANAVGENAFFGSPGIAPKAGKAVAQEVWAGLKDLINKNVDETAKKIGGPAARELRALNQEVSTLISARQGALYRATREATESTRLKDRVGAGLDLGLAVTSPTAFVAKKAVDIVGRPAFRATDERLAQLVAAARAGSTRAQIAQQALTFGFSPLVAEPLANFVEQKARETYGSGAP